MLKHASQLLFYVEYAVSFIQTKHDGALVACDICGSSSALFDPDWRRVRNAADGQPQHLCCECRKTAVWCETHHQYHRKEDNHRRACTSCGGLFTAQVQLHIEHCPACRRDIPASPRRAVRPTLWKYVQSHLLAYLV